MLETLAQHSQRLIAMTAQPEQALALGSAAVAALLVVISAFVRTMIPLRWLAVGIGNALIDVGGFTLLARLADEAVLARMFGFSRREKTTKAPPWKREMTVKTIGPSAATSASSSTAWCTRTC